MKSTRKVAYKSPMLRSPQIKLPSYSTRVSPQHVHDLVQRRIPFSNLDPSTPKIAKLQNALLLANNQHPQTEFETGPNVLTSPQSTTQHHYQKYNYSLRQSPNNNTMYRENILFANDLTGKRYGDQENSINALLGIKSRQPDNKKRQCIKILTYVQVMPKGQTVQLRSGNNQAQMFSQKKELKMSWQPPTALKFCLTSILSVEQPQPRESRSNSQTKQRVHSAAKHQSKTRNLSIQQAPEIIDDLTQKDMKTSKNTKFLRNTHNLSIEGIDEFFEYVLRYAIRTKRGYLPNNPNKINQDNYILCPNIGKKSYQHFFSVCDGHGMNGHFVSGFLKQFFPLLLNTKKDLLEQTYNISVIKSLFCIENDLLFDILETNN